MQILAVVFVYLGLIVVLTGGLSLIKPLTFLGVRNRRRGGVVLVVGLLIVAAGMFLPAREIKIQATQSQLDRFAPVYQFNEVHSIRIAAPRNRVIQAIKDVTANEILFFRTLIWIRRFGRSGPESILNAPERLPILEVATRTTFLLLEETDHEIVVGTVVLAPPGWRRRSLTKPEEFKTLREPGFAVATMNFLVHDAGREGCAVTTETRVYATDRSARRQFAAYWRVIYPWSALIRRMWLRATKRRVERNPVTGWHQKDADERGKR